MHPIIALLSPKRQKLLDGQITGEGEDRISNLPDGVLHHILSFLPTKDTIGTCILSKRWQFLWTSISNFDFEDSLYFCKDDLYPSESPMPSVLDFVDRVLAPCNVSNIKKFRLCCLTGTNKSHVNMWISAVIRRRVQELSLTIPFGKSMLPHCLFTCKSLTVLKLEIDCILEVPNSICLSSLRTFHLSTVTFLDDHSTQKLFSSCPVLQELSLIECQWKNLKSITIAIPTLKTLIIDYYPIFPIAEDLHDCEIKIYAERLTYFNCSGDLTINILLCNLSSLVDASISIGTWSGKQQDVEVAHRELNLLDGICNVKSLTLSHVTLKSLSFAEDLLNQLPTYTNLTYLELDDMKFGYCNSKALKVFLQYTPNLKSLLFAAGFDIHASFIIEEWISAPVPQCLESHLKKLSNRNFHGNEIEIHFLEFFLKNAAVLEKMEIFCSKNLSENLKKQEEVSNQLHRLPRGSTNCVIALL